MDDKTRNGLQAEQWRPIFEKGEKRANTLGSGAFRFIRTRSSIRRELKRQCNRSKNGDNPMVQEVGNSNSGGGLGKWLRDHLGGGSKGQGQDTSSPPKTNSSSFVGNSGNKKPCGRTVYTSQNLYCSLPREHGRHHAYNGARKIGHENPVKPQGYDRQRCASVNHHEKTTLSDLGTLTRGGPIYGSEGKTPKKRNRDRRRHSLNETHEHGRQRRRSKYDFNNWDEEEGEEDEEEEGHDETRMEKEKLTDEESAEWNVVSKWSDQDEAFHDEDEEVGEAEELFSSTTSTTEKLEEETRGIEDSVLAEIHGEISADREAIISRIKELQDELSELRRRNKMLELWIYRHMKKTQERTTPSDSTKTVEQMEQVYKEALRSYKMQIDEISSQQDDLKSEFEAYVQRMEMMKEDEQKTFDGFLDREKEVAIDLVFAKTGKKITEKTMNNLTRRQTARREVLARDRVRYVFLQHRLEDLKVRLRIAETLGEGMTTMDYEALHVANMGYKNRLDERDHELEKLRIKIAETVNGVAQYKEKEICIVEDIEHEQENLSKYRVASTNVRERVNGTRLALNDVRNTLNEKKTEAGLLVAQQELFEMEKMIKLRKILKDKISALDSEVQRYEIARHKLQEEVRKSQQH